MVTESAVSEKNVGFMRKLEKSKAAGSVFGVFELDGFGILDSMFFDVEMLIYLSLQCLSLSKTQFLRIISSFL